jgi:NAD(P)-dependent dehydrogenase (short-subunit alcohol dehydrogenase family)
MDLSGHRALITGAGQGIGRACAEFFAEKGAALILLDKNRRTLPTVVEAITLRGGRAEGHLIDLMHTGKLTRLVEALKGEGLIDILVNNAGFDRPGTTSRVDRKAFNDVLGIYWGYTW